MAEFEKRLACVISADGTIGSSLDEAVAPGLITVGLAKDPHQMQVHTYDPAGKPARRPFHIAVFRD